MASMRSRYFSTSPREVKRLDCRPACRSVIESSLNSKGGTVGDGTLGEVSAESFSAAVAARVEEIDSNAPPAAAVAKNARRFGRFSLDEVSLLPATDFALPTLEI